MNDDYPQIAGVPGRCPHQLRKVECLFCAKDVIAEQEIEIDRLRAELERLRGEREKELVRWFTEAALHGYGANWSQSWFSWAEVRKKAEAEARRRLAEEKKG